ncbi:MAG: tRNA preQ1(34) S-adenosylmethionine ribosyltransferase-isomerase QueA [Leptospiraceae bacterium]|nr:tRNA preQ1(34) S-adenosylmethionine ribosyltransferase-isomerase QueA [Leptospiraceae bacterium]
MAKFPSEKRDESRIMIVKRSDKKIIIENRFKYISNYLQSDDILIYNSTKVSKRRVYLYTENSRKHEVVFLEKLLTGLWKCLIRNSGKLKENAKLFSENKKYSFVYSRDSQNLYLNPNQEMTEEIFDEIGNIPIPPYMRREATKEDEVRYQTIFAKNPGSVAAPTAGLHFTDELKSDLINKGIIFSEVNLEVGYGTFAPLEKEQIENKRLHLENYYISDETAKLLNSRKKESRVISIGTTSLRALESGMDENKKFRSGSFQTEIFIQPGDRIDSIDGLVTNFHLPESSLLMLVCAFGGTELIMEAYNKAIKENFRFYSYGDAMLII